VEKELCIATRQTGPEESVQEMGTVEVVQRRQGVRFIVRDSGGRDVFVHASALQRAGIMSLHEGQRVFIGGVQGLKGREARSIPDVAEQG
jgi:cold shock protein